MTDKVAKAPLVLAKDEEGRFVYIYKGGTVPGNVPEDEVKRLEEDGFIGAPDDDDSGQPKPANRATAEKKS